MQTQTIFQAGNSYVVSIPKHLIKDMNLKPGTKVAVDKVNDDVIVVKKISSKQSVNSRKQSDREFNRWLKIFMEENGEILDELAVR